MTMPAITAFAHPGEAVVASPSGPIHTSTSVPAGAEFLIRSSPVRSNPARSAHVASTRTGARTPASSEATTFASSSSTARAGVSVLADSTFPR